jgi:hypothetical protein
MDERERRTGLNEALFREVNERIERLSRGVRADEQLEIICECGDIDCDARLTLTVADYESVRADPTRFVVCPGHEVADVERVVEERDGYLVIEKRPGGPAELSELSDPRS